MVCFGGGYSMNSCWICTQTFLPCFPTTPHRQKHSRTPLQNPLRNPHRNPPPCSNTKPGIRHCPWIHQCSDQHLGSKRSGRRHTRGLYLDIYLYLYLDLIRPGCHVGYSHMLSHVSCLFTSLKNYELLPPRAFRAT